MKGVFEVTNISRNQRITNTIETLLLNNPSISATILSLYSSEISDLQELYPQLRFIIVPEKEQKSISQYVVSKKSIN